MTIASPIPQDNNQATYSHKITKQDAAIDWTQAAKSIDHQIRAFHPKPICHTTFGGETLRIWKATYLTDPVDAPPGKIVAIQREGLDIATGSGILRIQQLQFPNK